VDVEKGVRPRFLQVHLKLNFEGVKLVAVCGEGSTNKDHPRIKSSERQGYFDSAFFACAQRPSNINGADNGTMCDADLQIFRLLMADRAS
jgi:hypothetical protein